jgi:two-component system sensor histidine kinase PrrB
VRSLRVRVALAAIASVALILLAVGALLVRGFERSERSALDDRLRQRAGPAARAAPVALPPGERPPGERPYGGRPPDPPPGVDRAGLPAPPPPGFLRGSGDATRLLVGGEVVETIGDPRAASLPIREEPGFDTVHGDGGSWRTFVAPVRQPPGARVEVLASLGPLDARVARLRRRLVFLGGLGLAGAAAAGWLLSTAALRSLERLRGAARSVSSTEDLSVRLPSGGGPVEVDEVATALNAMLARLEASSAETIRALEATRRFAADAGHELRTPLTALGTNLDTLSRNPELGPGERARVLDNLQAEQQRTVALLDALQSLARGDAGAVMEHREIDIAELADQALASARQRHKDVDFTLEAGGSPRLVGWEQGLRLAIDNLLDNAALHGGRQVRVSVVRADDAAHLTVEDDGPGIAVAERDRVLERFVRGAAAEAPGSGLGLSLVDQQAALHRGRVTIGESPLGGARVELVLRDL